MERDPPSEDLDLLRTKTSPGFRTTLPSRGNEDRPPRDPPRRRTLLRRRHESPQTLALARTSARKKREPWSLGRGHRHSESQGRTEQTTPGEGFLVRGLNQF